MESMSFDIRQNSKKDITTNGLQETNRAQRLTNLPSIKKIKVIAKVIPEKKLINNELKNEISITNTLKNTDKIVKLLDLSIKNNNNYEKNDSTMVTNRNFNEDMLLNTLNIEDLNLEKETYDHEDNTLQNKLKNRSLNSDGETLDQLDKELLSQLIEEYSKSKPTSLTTQEKTLLSEFEEVVLNTVKKNNGPQNNELKNNLNDDIFYLDDNNLNLKDDIILNEVNKDEIISENKKQQVDHKPNIQNLNKNPKISKSTVYELKNESLVLNRENQIKKTEKKSPKVVQFKTLFLVASHKQLPKKDTTSTKERTYSKVLNNENKNYQLFAFHELSLENKQKVLESKYDYDSESLEDTPVPLKAGFDEKGNIAEIKATPKVQQQLESSNLLHKGKTLDKSNVKIKTFSKEEYLKFLYVVNDNLSVFTKQIKDQKKEANQKNRLGRLNFRYYPSFSANKNLTSAYLKIKRESKKLSRKFQTLKRILILDYFSYLEKRKIIEKEKKIEMQKKRLGELKTSTENLKELRQEEEIDKSLQRPLYKKNRKLFRKKK